MAGMKKIQTGQLGLFSDAKPKVRTRKKAATSTAKKAKRKHPGINQKTGWLKKGYCYCPGGTIQRSTKTKK